MLTSYIPDLPSILQLVIATLLPLLVGLVTKMSDSSAYKAILLLVLAAVSSVLNIWLTAIHNNTDVNWKNVLINVALTFVVAVATHFGLWKPSGASAQMQRSGVKDKPAQPVVE
jgi:uncharacterized membrane protein